MWLYCSVMFAKRSLSFDWLSPYIPWTLLQFYQNRSVQKYSSKSGNAIDLKTYSFKPHKSVWQAIIIFFLSCRFILTMSPSRCYCYFRGVAVINMLGEVSGGVRYNGYGEGSIVFLSHMEKSKGVFVSKYCCLLKRDEKMNKFIILGIESY